MTIDITKIRPGDKVTLVPLEVVGENFEGFIAVKDAGACPALFRPDQIAAHHPAPREFQVGDRVKWDGCFGVIDHVARGKARVLWEDGNDDLNPCTHLTLVEVAE